MTEAVPHPRDVIDILQALLTPLVAAIAVGIAFAQYWTARNRLKLDLFDRRWAIYQAARAMVSEICVHGKSSPEAEQAYLRGIQGANWLFDKKVEHYLTKELWSRIATLNAVIAMQEVPANREATIKKKYEVVTWFNEQSTALDLVFDKFLSMDRSFWGTLSNWLRQRC